MTPFFVVAVFFLINYSTPALIKTNQPDYILDVVAACPSTPRSDETAIFTVLADVPANARATCHGNYSYSFIPTGDGVTSRLTVGFNQSKAAEKCVFEQHGDVEVFVVTVEVQWGHSHGFLMTRTGRYKVSCTFGKQTSTSEVKPVEHGTHSSDEVKPTEVPVTNSTLELRLVDARSDPFTSYLPMGRMVQLEAVSDGAGGEKGIRVLSCVAKNSVVSYTILQEGCGDGIVFGKNAGFKTKGLMVHSPFFEGFRLKGSMELTFVCNFTTCDTTCNGNSCKVSHKRSVRNREHLRNPATVKSRVPLSQHLPNRQPIPITNSAAVIFADPKFEVTNKSTPVPEKPTLVPDNDAMATKPRSKHPIISVSRTLIVQQPEETSPWETSPEKDMSLEETPITLNTVPWMAALLSVAGAMLILSTIVLICVHVNRKETKTVSPVVTRSIKCTVDRQSEI